ncbi:MAG TPA: hypothetical protein VFQ35_04840 [Polyangiaceae bacterium]|nr:hypothetical protein [Polyangiaceae bacterium]
MTRTRPKRLKAREARLLSLLLVWAATALLITLEGAGATTRSATASTRASQQDERTLQKPALFDAVALLAGHDELSEPQAGARSRSASRPQPHFAHERTELFAAFGSDRLARTTPMPTVSHAVVFRKRIPRFSSDEPP